MTIWDYVDKHHGWWCVSVAAVGVIWFFYSDWRWAWPDADPKGDATP